MSYEQHTQWLLKNFFMIKNIFIINTSVLHCHAVTFYVAVSFIMLVFSQLCALMMSWSDFRMVEAAAPGTTAAPAAQADNTATMATVIEAETATAVSEEHLSQAAVHHTAEVKTAEAPVASSESSAAKEATAR